MREIAVNSFGRTGAELTRLGYGSWELRGPEGPAGRELEEDTACQLLNSVLDAGVNVIDTSPDYGKAEELIGKAISGRRDEYFLASKCGCPVGASPDEFADHDFTPQNIRAGVEQSLRRMKTDLIDLVQFHESPSRSTLEQEDSVAALQDLQREGLVRFIGMSGELPHLADHIAMGPFDAFQIPYSALEREHEDLVTAAAIAGAGTIIRGGAARGMPDPDEVARQFTFEKFPESMRAQVPQYLEMFAQRKRRLQKVMTQLALLDGMSNIEFLLRFTLSHPHVHTIIVGTANQGHFAANLAAAAKGPLPPDLYERAMRCLGPADIPANEE